MASCLCIITVYIICCVDNHLKKDIIDFNMSGANTKTCFIIHTAISYFSSNELSIL